MQYQFVLVLFTTIVVPTVLIIGFLKMMLLRWNDGFNKMLLMW